MGKEVKRDTFFLINDAKITFSLTEYTKIR